MKSTEIIKHEVLDIYRHIDSEYDETVLEVLVNKDATDEELIVLSNHLNELNGKGVSDSTNTYITYFTYIESLDFELCLGEFSSQCGLIKTFCRENGFEDVIRCNKIYQFETVDDFLVLETEEALEANLPYNSMNILIQEDLNKDDIYSIFLQIKSKSPEIDVIFVEVAGQTENKYCSWYCSDIEKVVSKIYKVS